MSLARFLLFFRYLTPKTIRRTVQAAGQQRLPGLAAEMAYNSMLALFPAMLMLFTAIGLFAPLNNTFLDLAERLSAIAPDEVLGILRGFATQVSTSQNSGLFSLSFVIALWASSGALTAAMTALDQIRQIPFDQKRPFWKARLVAIGLTLGTVVLLLLALTLIFISDLVVRLVAERSASLETGLLTLWRLLTLPIALGIVSLTFAFIYRFGPSRWNPGQPLMPGAVLAAVFWAIISDLFRYYVTHYGRYNVVYGTVGAVIVLLLWLYLGSLVLLIGDQLNVTVGEAMRKGKRLERSERRSARHSDL